MMILMQLRVRPVTQTVRTVYKLHARQAGAHGGQVSFVDLLWLTVEGKLDGLRGEHQALQELCRWHLMGPKPAFPSSLART